MKRLFLIIALLCPTILSRAQDISLDGEWSFWLPNDSVTRELPTSVKECRTVRVPHTYNLIEGLEDYAGRAVYQRMLPVTPNMKGKNVRVHFDAVYHDAIVYVNGQKVGEHLGKGYTPFSLDITPFLHFSEDSDNVIKVECSNAYSEQTMPYMRKFDWNNDGGIYRSVRLHVSGKNTIRYVHVDSNVQLSDSTGCADFKIRLFNERTKAIHARLKVVNRQTGETVLDIHQKLAKNRNAEEFVLNADMGKVQLWHFDSPNLYDFILSVMDGKVVSDTKTDHFGFREFKIVDESFVLNGEEVRLPGIESMPGSHPEYGAAESFEVMDSMVNLMKDLNCTITRFHWIQDKKLLTLMDEKGILVQEELSWWQQPYKEFSHELRKVARETLAEMIEAHYNHPCIYGWGLSNEVHDNHAELCFLKDFVKNLDTKRIVNSMSNRAYDVLDKDPSFQLDIPTWNDYTGSWHGKNREELPGRLERIGAVLKGRPLFITEAGLCEPAHTGGDTRRIDDMIYHIKEWQKKPFVCGYIYFCLQDYRTQMGEEGVGKWRIRRHGVTQSNFTPKASYQVLRQLASPVQITEVSPAKGQKNYGSLAGQYEIDVTNRDVRVVLAIKNSIPSYILRGYTLQYEDAEGKVQRVSLPDMHPGQSYPFILQNMNSRFSFGVLRPTGYSVIAY